MPPKPERRLTADEIIEVFSEERVIDAITRALKPAILDILESCLEDKLTKLFDKRFGDLAKENKSLQEKMSSLTAENLSLRKAADDVKAANARLEKCVHDISLECNSTRNECRVAKKCVGDLESYTRRDNLILHGVPAVSTSDAASGVNDSSSATAYTNDDTEMAVLKLCNEKLNLSLTKEDISIAHRLPAINRRAATAGATSGANLLPAPIVVKFTKRKSRDAVYRARLQLKNVSPRVYINEHLSADNATLYQQARQLVKAKGLVSAWTMNGIVVR